MLLADPERTANVIDTLMRWYSGQRDGVMSGAELPESKPPLGVVRGSYEHIMFVTLAVSIDYQRSAVELWDAARATMEDEPTSWVFPPLEVSERNKRELIAALAKHRLSRKPVKDAGIWRTVASSFFSLFQGDPKKLFETYDYDALEIYRAMRTRYAKSFPYLAGATGTSKILSLRARRPENGAGSGIRTRDLQLGGLTSYQARPIPHRPRRWIHFRGNRVSHSRYLNLRLLGQPKLIPEKVW